MDLGLNEFRLDLLEFMKDNPDIESSPYGLHAIVPFLPELPPGIIYVLKNINENINIDKQNRLHPFYMVYIADSGEVICDHLSPKELLDTMRFLCKGNTTPIDDLCHSFNHETKNGKNMKKYSKLLGDAINSIVDIKGKKEIDSFLGGESMSFMSNKISGLDDFELICFLVVI
jgi:hypothetical protein